MSNLYIPDFSEILAVAQSRGAGCDAPHLWNELAGHWPIAAGGGATAYEVSGLGNPGTLMNMDPATDWVVTEKGYALDFVAGSSQYATIGDLSVAESGRFTYACWFKTSEGGNDHWIVAEGSTASDAPIVGLINQSGVLRGFFRVQAGGGSQVVGSTTINDGVWHHLAFTCDGTDMRVYVDGKSDASPVARQAGTPALNTCAICALVRASVGQYVTGQVSSATIWSRGLLASEIQQLASDEHIMVRSRRQVYAAAAAAPSFVPYPYPILEPMHGGMAT